MTTDVLVVGGGPTGLVLAAQLNAAGVSVRIVDRHVDRVRESRALAVQARTLEVLRGLGVTQALLERGNQAVDLQMHGPERVARLPLFGMGARDTAFPFLLFISQAHTEAILHEHLSATGVEVERGVELIDFSAGDEGVDCILSRGGREENVRARYLVGCDGANSTVRRIADIAFLGGDYPQTFALADLEVDGSLDPGAVHVFAARAGMLFFFPLGDPATWRMMGMRRHQHDVAAESDACPEAPSLDALQALCDVHTGGGVRLHDPVWSTYFRLRHRQAAAYRRGRVFVAGDAAHVHSPAGAQGMNTGIQDAWNLGWKLALVSSGAAGEGLLDSYDAERRPIGRFVVRFSDRAFSIGTSTNPLIGFLRAHLALRVAPLGLRFEEGRKRAFRTISELDVHYRRSPVVEEGRPRLHAGARAGDRLPDAQIAHEGRAGWLQEVLAEPTFHLLLCGPPDDWPSDGPAAWGRRWGGLVRMHRLARRAAPGVVLDRDGHAFSRLGAEDTAHYLVRPDGYIGFRAAGTDLRQASAHLEHFLGGGDREQPLD